MNVLFTGGMGYIGSHTAIVLLQLGHRIVLYDNLSNSCDTILKKLKHITGQLISFVKGDVRDTELLKATLAAYPIEAVIHFAGLKAVGELVENPVDYYANNVQGTISLLQAVQSAQVKTLVFSSSATVYGEPQYLPIDENGPTSATNPYGRSKPHIEEILRDVVTQTLSGGLHACVISTRLAPTKVVSLVRAIVECRITSCLTSSKRRLGGERN